MAYKSFDNSTIKKNKSGGNDRPRNSGRKENQSYIFLALSGILLFTFILYSRVINFDFVNWDDNQFFVDNFYIRNFSFQGVKDIFLNTYKGDYQPLATLTWLFELKFFGFGPEVFHRTNLVIHLINIILVYIFINSLSGNKVISLLTALFFAIHPLHVESVAWNSERKDVLYSLFYLSSLILYINYLKKNYKPDLLIYSIVLFILSLLSKAMAVTLPIVLILIDYFFQRKIFSKKVLAEKIPFFILSLVIGLITLNAQKSIMPDLSVTYSFLNRIFLVTYSFSFYIVQLIFPFKLSILHYYPLAKTGFLPVEFYLSLILLLFIGWLIFKYAKGRKFITFGVMFFIITVSPVIQLVPVGMAIVSERYTYLTGLGIFFVIFSLLVKLAENTALKKIIYLSLSIFVIYYSIYTWNRVKIWQNGMTLWSNYVDNNPDFFYGYFALGGNLEKEKKFNDEIDCLNKCISLNPNFEKAYNDRGKTRFFLGDVNGALDDLGTALRINPKAFESLNNRGWIYFTINKYPEAIADYKAALEINGHSLLALKNLAWVYYNNKDFAEAVNYYNSVISISVNDPSAYHYRGMAYLNLKNLPEACRDWTKALELGNSESGSMLSQYCK